jgi:hypothetical protein
MANPIQSTGNKPRKLFSKGRLILYSLALIGFVWLCIWAYWAFFKLKLWLAGFGTGVFWVVGLIAGFAYFYIAHKLHAEIKTLPSGALKAGAYTSFGLGVLILNPFPMSAAVWLFTPPGALHTASFWFFVGCAMGVGIVLGLERLFSKKKPKIVAR